MLPFLPFCGGSVQKNSANSCESATVKADLACEKQHANKLPIRSIALRISDSKTNLLRVTRQAFAPPPSAQSPFSSATPCEDYHTDDTLVMRASIIFIYYIHLHSFCQGIVSIFLQKSRFYCILPSLWRFSIRRQLIKPYKSLAKNMTKHMIIQR